MPETVSEMLWLSEAQEVVTAFVVDEAADVIVVVSVLVSKVTILFAAWEIEPFSWSGCWKRQD